MPRPTRMRALVAPGWSAISLSFIALFSFVDHADKVAHAGNHAAHGRIVGKRLPPADLVEAETDQRCALLARATLRAAGLLDRDGLAVALRGHRQLLTLPRLRRRRRRGGAIAASRPSCPA